MYRKNRYKQSMYRIVPVIWYKFGTEPIPTHFAHIFNFGGGIIFYLVFSIDGGKGAKEEKMLKHFKN